MNSIKFRCSQCGKESILVVNSLCLTCGTQGNTIKPKSKRSVTSKNLYKEITKILSKKR